MASQSLECDEWTSNRAQSIVARDRKPVVLPEETCAAGAMRLTALAHPDKHREDEGLGCQYLGPRFSHGSSVARASFSKQVATDPGLT